MNKYLVRLQRHSPDNGFIDYNWGPHENIDYLFKRIYDYLATETISEQYKAQVAVQLARYNKIDQKELMLPYLITFCIDDLPGFTDLWLVELVDPLEAS